jgi:hypothetical protein
LQGAGDLSCRWWHKECFFRYEARGAFEVVDVLDVVREEGA